MKNKILLAIIIIGLLYVGDNISYSCTTDSNCYQEYLIIEGNNSYTNYYYNGKTYKIPVPETRAEFIYLENKYLKGTLNKKNKYYKTIILDILLVKKGLEPLYY